MRNDGQTKRIFKNFIDRKAHTIDSDRTFWYDVSDELCINRDKNIVAVAIVFDVCHSSDGIDMPLNDVAFKLITHAHGRFNMNFVFIVFKG